MSQDVTLAKTTIDDLINSIYTTTDIQPFVRLILQRFHTLTVYIIEPYVPQNEGPPIKIPFGELYSIYDYGGRMVITPNDIYNAPLFACGEFFNAIESVIKMLVDSKTEEIAILGDQRAKLFIWDKCERLNTIEKIPLKLINFSPPETFSTQREFVNDYLKAHNMQAKIFSTALRKTPQTNQ